MPRLRDLGEFEAIRRLTAARGRAIADAGVVVDAGDDAAVLAPRPGRELVATTDVFLEGVHFLGGWLTAGELGGRLAIANLSDLAAMAASPRWALLSIGARPEHDLDDLIETERGLADALAADGAAVVGGNITAVSGAEWLNLTLLGEGQPGRAWKRSGARPGDLIAVTGHPGRSGAGCALARRLGSRAREARWRPLLDAWLRPRSRVRLAWALAASDAVTAATDLSDGFAGDLGHVGEASGVGAEIDAALWPADDLLAAAASALGMGEEDLRLGPSDDYELLLAIDPARAPAAATIAEREGSPLHVVGRFIGGSGPPVRVAPDGSRRAIAPGGWDHFGGATAGEPNP